MSFRKTGCASAVLALILSGCGGGGSSPTAATTKDTATPTAVSGKVIDGYITGAVVYLDLNANQTRDDGEPTATTTAGGVYSLNTTGLDPAKVAKGYLLVTVPGTATDSDDGGQTLAAAGKKPYSMIAPVPANQASSMVTPLTTLVANQMISKGQTAEQATQTVRTALGLPDSANLAGDFKADTGASASPALALMAKVTAVAMGELQAAIKTGADSATPREQLLASLKELTSAVASLNASLDIDADSPATKTVAVTQIKTAVASTAADVQSNAVDSIAATKAITEGVSTTLEALLAQGFGDIQTYTNCSSSSISTGSSTPTTSGSVSSNTCVDVISVYLTVSGKVANTFQEESYNVTADAAPTPRNESEYSSLMLFNAGWAFDTHRGTYAIQSDGKVLVKGSGFGEGTGVGSFSVQNLEGKSISSVGEVVGPEAKFPAGAQQISSNFYRNEAGYELYNPVQNNRSFGQYFANLSGLLEGVKTPADGSKDFPNYWSWEGVSFTFDDLKGGSSALSDESAGTVTFYTSFNPDSAGRFLEKGAFVAKLVKGKLVLVISRIPPTVISAAGGGRLRQKYQAGVRPMFAVDDRGGVNPKTVWFGEARPAGPTGDNDFPSFNKIGLNAILKARGLKPLP